MSPVSTIYFPMCLSEARKRAGYNSREIASTHVPWSPEAIGRHERGEAGVGPNGALIYADCYGAPEILTGYCEDCPIGRRMGVTYMYQLRAALVGVVSISGQIKTAVSEALTAGGMGAT